MIPTFEFETKVRRNYKAKVIAGVDEVGRGALAGPIVAGAVVFDHFKKIEPELNGINDSKILTKRRRQELSELIKMQAVDYSIGLVDSEEIDQYGIGAANVIAFKRALDGLQECEFALIDGRRFRGFEYPFMCLEKGESKSLSIAAASIIAKVFRDELMIELGFDFPEYEFKTNKGYGSEKHMECLRRIGPSVHHRKSFLDFLRRDRFRVKLF